MKGLILTHVKKPMTRRQLLERAQSCLHEQDKIFDAFVKWVYLALVLLRLQSHVENENNGCETLVTCLRILFEVFKDRAVFVRAFVCVHVLDRGSRGAIASLSISSS